MRIDAIKSVRNENTLKKSDKVCYSHKRVENIEARPKLELSSYTGGVETTVS